MRRESAFLAGKGRWASRLLVVGTALAAGLISASSAAASSVSGPFSDEFVAAPGEANNVTITRVANNFVITDTAGVTDNSTECTQNTPNQVTCVVHFLHIALGDMNDVLTVTQASRFGELTAAGGDGDDRIDFSAVGAEQPGSSGSNQPSAADLRGDAGNDTMIGSQTINFFDQVCQGLIQCPDFDLGDDTMIGGPATDRMSGGRGSDSLDGRAGIDLLDGVRQLPPSTPFPTGIFTAEDNAVDTIFCGEPGASVGGGDTVWAGAGDQVGIDCEQIQQQVECPPTGALCDGTPLISTTVAAAASGSAATVAKKKKRKNVVLGRAEEKLKVRSGQSASVFIDLASKKVRRALGKRKRMTVTFSQNFDRIKKGRKVGEANRRKRFKMGKP